MDLNFELHGAQQKIFFSPKRFKIVLAGRRFGKTYLSAILAIINGLKDKNEFGYDLKGKDVWYIAPTFQQGKDNIWGLLKELGQGVIKSVHENTGVLTLINGRKICVKGSDKPENLRGVGLSYAILDEYATMKPSVWELIIRPTLADVRGGAFFIGTPAGKNHFYNLYCSAQASDDWETFKFSSRDNPFLHKDEIEAMTADMSESAIRQEVEASFESTGGGILRGDLIKFITKDEYKRLKGSHYITVDPAGFAEVTGQVTSKLKKLDETAIASVLVHDMGWHIEHIDYGRWGVRETALRILKAYRDHRPNALGIEKGMAKNAVLPYLNDEQMRLGIHFTPHELTHGGKKKTDRISWALQGRLEKRKITVLEDEKNEPWVKHLISQMFDFPNPMAHDDLIDALAYIDQIATTCYIDDFEIPNWEPLDATAGY